MGRRQNMKNTIQSILDTVKVKNYVPCIYTYTYSKALKYVASAQMANQSEACG